MNVVSKHFALSAALIVLLSACALEKDGPVSQVGNTSSNVVGIRNYQAMYSNMLTTTGVVADPNTSDNNTKTMMARFTQTSTRFSIDGDSAITGPMAIAIAQLADSVCAAAVSTNKLPLPANVNPLTSGSSIANLSTPAQVQALIAALSPQLWGRAPTADESTALVKAVSALVANPVTAKTSDNAQLTTVVRGTCTIFLSSPQSYSNLPN